MRDTMDPLGGLLMRLGLLSEEELGDVLKQQEQGFPFASVCYALGYADEETLVRTLSRQMGLPGVLLEQSIIALDNLKDVPFEIATRYAMLPMYEDHQMVFVAFADVRDTAIINELEIIKAKSVVPHLALHISLARAIREAYRLYFAGESYWFGPRTDVADLVDPRGVLVPVLDVDELPSEVEPEPIDVTSPNFVMSEGPGDADEITDDEVLEEHLLDEEGYEDDLGLDEGPPLAEGRRILVVDSDEDSRRLIGRILEPEGHEILSCATGLEAVRLLRQHRPDLLITEVMLPEINGYQLCRTIKASRRYGSIAVVFATRTDSAQRMGRDLVEKYGADEFVAKPVGHSDLVGTVNSLLAREKDLPAPPEEDEQALFDQAIELYGKGETDEAVRLLRQAIEIEPLSPRMHFVLGNILQHQGKLYEAIDAYERTVDLRPDYFPGLSRLAYLCYKKGFLTRAVDIWRRSLAHCPDEEQATRIRTFMKELEEELADRRG